MATRKQNLTELFMWTVITIALLAVLAAALGVNVRIMNDRTVSDGAAMLSMFPTCAMSGFFIQRQWAWGKKIWESFKYEQ